MRAMVRVIATLAFALIVSICFGQDPDQPFSSYQAGSLDYWQAKIRDRNTNFNDLQEEFRQYWEGKVPQKGSGYKQISRWLEYNSIYANADGTIRLPQEDLENAMNYNLLYSAQAISGDWTYAGPFQPIQNPTDGSFTAADGRVTAIAFSPHDPQTIFVGAPLGGLWVSHNSGASWQNMNTDQIASLGVSAIAVHPVNPDIIYIGTGDRDKGMTKGTGIYKSSDGGQTWVGKPINNVFVNIVNKIFIHPQTPDTIVIAGNGGIFVSFNGGDSWQRTKQGYFFDMEQKPGEPLTLYAVTKTQFYKSINFGINWSQFMTVPTDRMAIGVTAANPSKVLLFATKNSQFYRVYNSLNSGTTFDTIFSTGTSPGEGQGGYNLDVIIDPNNENIAYAGMINFYKSVNGGNTWVNQEDVYADDQHTFEFHPVTHRLYIGNDSGIWYTDNGTNYNYSSNGLNITAIYRMDVAADNPEHIITGNQDGATFVSNGTGFFRHIAGDGMTCKFDYTDDNYIYGSSQCGNIKRSTDGNYNGQRFRYIALSQNGINQGGNWQTSFLLDHTNPNYMFAGMRDVWKCNNVKTPDTSMVSWTNISNGAFGQDVTIEFMKQSRNNRNILYVFTDHKGIYRTDNLLATNPVWLKLQNPNSGGDVRFETHPADENIVYMVCGTKVYKSTNKGTNWDSIPGNLPNIGMRSIVYMLGSNEGLYVGTVAGVYYKDAGMTDWVPFKTGIPLTHVYEMVINYSTTPAQLFAATFGRGIWKTTVLPAYRPDIVLLTGTATVNSTTVNASCTLQNSNNMLSLSDVKTGYYLSTDQIILNSDYLVYENNEALVEPGDEFQSHINYDVALAQPEAPAGTYYLGMYGDNPDEIDETNENNNKWVPGIQVTIPENPASPVNVQASDGTFQDKVTITWENNTGQTLYFAVFRFEGPFPFTWGAEQISPATWISATSFDDFTGENGTSYYYWVKASRYPGGIRASDLSTSNSGWKALNPPVNVQASDGQFGDRVTITWPSVTGATNYRVYRNTSNVISETMYISGTTWIYDTTFNDMTAAYGTTYYYWVRAANSQIGAYASGFSAANTGWVGFVTAPDATATDGTYTNRVNLSWNTVNAATHYMLYRNTFNDPETATAITGWQTAITYSDVTAITGTVYYYWVKAAQDPGGNIATGFGNMDSGFRNYVAPSNVIAADGADTRYTQVTWQSSPGATWYKVYRGIVPSLFSAISSWRNSLLFRDATGTPGMIYYYSVRASGDTNVVISARSTENDGYRKISAPRVDATIGIFPGKVMLTWLASAGADYYMIQRSTIENPTARTTLSNWSNTLNYQFEDLSAVLNQRYNYYITGAVNSSGLRAGNTGQATGMAGTCGNLEDDPSHRSIDFHGTTLDLEMRLINLGPYPLQNAGLITVYLENASPNGIPEATLGTIAVPPLATGAYADLTYSVDISTIPGFSFTYGTWHVTFNLSCDNGNCDSNPADNYLVWQDPFFNYTDALHGIYTIGNTGCDYKSPDMALDALYARGISDPVTFYLMPEEFGEQLVFNEISGTGPAKKIRFTRHPDFPDTATIVAVPNENENYTLRFINSSYITFENLRLATFGSSDFQSTYGCVIEIGPGCNDLKFIFNTISGFTDDSHISSDNSAIYCTNISSSNLLFEGNTILHGAYGIYLSGANLTNSPISNLQIIKNRIHGFQRGGINLENLDHPVISGNELIQENAAESNIDAMNIYKVRNGFEINSNKISLTGNASVNYGIALQDMNMDGAQPGLISNNFISLGSNSSNNYGLSVSDCNKTRILHNSINIYGTPGVFSSGIMIDCSDVAFQYDNSLVNNNVINQIGGYCLTISENALNFDFLSESDFNNFRTSGTNIILYRGIPMPTIQTWYAETGLDLHSHSIDPAYSSNTDLHCNREEFNNLGTFRPEATSDFDGEARSLTTPDIGADEFTPGPPAKTLYLACFLEGLYAGNNLMRPANNENGPQYGTGIADHIRIELHSSSNYNTILYTSGEVNLSIQGLAIFSIPGQFSGSYYITIKHRNSIVTTTASPVSFAGNTPGFNMDSPAKAFGGNLSLMADGKYVIYGGDVNQDGSVDIGDMTPVDNAASNFISGYLASDVNGDGTIDIADMTIIDNNGSAFVNSNTP